MPATQSNHNTSPLVLLSVAFIAFCLPIAGIALGYSPPLSGTTLAFGLCALFAVVLVGELPSVLTTSVGLPLYLGYSWTLVSAQPDLLRFAFFSVIIAAVPLFIRSFITFSTEVGFRLGYFGLNMFKLFLGSVLFFQGLVLVKALGPLWSPVLMSFAVAMFWWVTDRLLGQFFVSETNRKREHQEKVYEKFSFGTALLGFTLLAFMWPGLTPLGAVFATAGLACAHYFVWPGLASVMVSDNSEEVAQLQSQLRQSHMQAQRLNDEIAQACSEAELRQGELNTVHQMANELGESYDLAGTLKALHTVIKRLRIPYESCVVFMVVGNGTKAVIKDSPFEKELDGSSLLAVEEPVVRDSMADKRSRFYPKLDAAKAGDRIFKGELSVMCVPLIVSNDVLGAVYIGSRNSGTHKEEHFDALKTVATFSAPFLKSALLFQGKQREVESERQHREVMEAKNKQLAGLQKLGQAIGGTLDVDNTYGLVAKSLQEMLPEAQSVIIVTSDIENPNNHAMTAAFSSSPYVDYVKNLSLRDDEGVIGRAIDLQSTILVHDTEQYDTHNILTFERSVVVAPLVARLDDKKEPTVLGVLYVGAQNEQAFNEADRSLIETVSYQTAMALKNARLYEKTQQMALTDGLTGLYTHRLFQVRMEDEVRWADRNNGKFCLVMVDTDNFKTFNDTLGHPAGDALLKEIASLLKDKVRTTDVVCRYGGDEFALILRDTDKEAAMMTGERIREAFQLRLGKNEVQVTASIGIACYPTDADSKKDLAKAADDALYVSKRSGRNRVTASPTKEERLAQGDIEQEVLPR